MMNDTKENDEKTIQIRIDIDGKTRRMFEKFMKHYNIERYTDTFRLIVKRAYDLEGFTEENVE